MSPLRDGSPAPIPLARLRAALEQAGAPPRKRHGQHFLIDNNLLACMVQDSGCGAGDGVLEIGPGPGLLTRHLLATGARVVAIEIDPAQRSVAGLLIEERGWERLEWVVADALDGPRALSAPVQTRLSRCRLLVSNLPYNAAGSILGCLFVHAEAPERLVVTVQREVGERLLARPGSGQYGSLGVLAALCTHGEVLRPVPPTAFWPRPRVESVVVGFDRRPDRPTGPQLEALQSFLGGAFHARRKTLVNSLATLARCPPREVVRRLELPENLQNCRAEALDPVQLFVLAQRWATEASSGRNRS
jgi:16S rRNA (adenine1518-N6/adenine1519-N6)-dimethyltransferase